MSQKLYIIIYITVVYFILAKLVYYYLQELVNIKLMLELHKKIMQFSVLN